MSDRRVTVTPMSIVGGQKRTGPADRRKVVRREDKLHARTIAKSLGDNRTGKERRSK